MIADTKEHIAANDMVPIEKRLNPAVSQNNAAMATSTSPNVSTKVFNTNNIKLFVSLVRSFVTCKINHVLYCWKSILY